MKSLAELAAIKAKAQNNLELRKKEGADKRIMVGMATCGIAAGARPVLAAFVDEVGTRGLKDVLVSQTGCIGLCRLEPIAEVFMPGQEKVTYVELTAEKAKRIVSEHIVNGNVVTEYTIGYAEQRDKQ